jgi:hypothetical protein
MCHSFYHIGSPRVREFSILFQGTSSFCPPDQPYPFTPPISLFSILVVRVWILIPLILALSILTRHSLPERQLQLTLLEPLRPLPLTVLPLVNFDTGSRGPSGCYERGRAICGHHACSWVWTQVFEIPGWKQTVQIRGGLAHLALSGYRGCTGLISWCLLEYFEGSVG